jgi:hypothetical protein
MPDNQMRVFGSRAFQNNGNGKLWYLEIPDGLRQIHNFACFNLGLKMENIHTGKNVYRIGDSAFNNCIAEKADIASFTIGGSVVQLGRLAVANWNEQAKISQLYWGGQGDPAQLSQIGGKPIFKMNDPYNGGFLGNMEIYCTADKEAYFRGLIADGTILPNETNPMNISITITT